MICTGSKEILEEFKKFQRRKLSEGFNHQPGCKYEKYSAPIDVCACGCYEFEVFKAGYEKGKEK